MDGLVFAKSALSTTTEHGVVIKLASGEPWPSYAPLVKQRPHLFGDLPPRVRTENGWIDTTEVIETATRAPGEKRRTKRG